MSAVSKARFVPSFRRNRLEMKLSPFFTSNFFLFRAIVYEAIVQSRKDNTYSPSEQCKPCLHARARCMTLTKHTDLFLFSMKTWQNRHGTVVMCVHRAAARASLEGQEKIGRRTRIAGSVQPTLFQTL